MTFKYMYKHFVSSYFHSLYIGAWNYYRHRCSICTVNLNEVSYSEWGVFKLHSDTVP